MPPKPTKNPDGTVNQDVKTRRRTGPKRATAGHEWDILAAYLENKSEEEIAKPLGVKPSTIKAFISKTIKSLVQAQETRSLLKSHELDVKGDRYSWAPTKALNTKVNEPFLELLSSPEDPVLSEAERMFAYLLIYEGDAKAAIVDSGLDVGLTKSIGKTELDRNLELRATFLKSKPNLLAHMKELQLQFTKDFAVNKESIQAEIWRTITYLRNQNDPKNAPTIAKLLNDLGRTEGVFVDKSVVDNKFSLDDSFEMMEQRKRELLETQESPQVALCASGTYVDPGVIEAEYEQQPD